MSSTLPVYRRILLKLSGEALLGKEDYGIDPEVLRGLASEIIEVAKSGVQIGLVDRRRQHLPRRRAWPKAAWTACHRRPHGHARHRDEFARAAGCARKARRHLPRHERDQDQRVCEDYIRRRAIRHLEKGRIVMFAAGTGNPFFTTDSAAALRAVEINADLLLKATKVDGLYSADPVKDPTAVKFDRISYDSAIERKLAVMDTTAFALCRDYRMPIRVYDLHKRGDLARIVKGESVGTLVDQGA
jgi:uridylate kinase